MKALSAVFPALSWLLVLAAQTVPTALNGRKTKNAFFSGREIPGKVIASGIAGLEAGKTIVRGMIQQAQDLTNDKRVNGTVTIEAKACLDPVTSLGLLWGTFVLQNEAGKWLAAWIGQITDQGTTIYAMGYGIEAYHDLMANWTYTRQGQEQKSAFDIQGFIVKTKQIDPAVGNP